MKINWKKLFDSIGLNGTKWQWRIYQFERSIKESLSQPGENKRLRMNPCRKCGTLNPRGESCCYQCGARLLPMWLGKLLKVGGLDHPGTTTLLSLIFIWFVMGLAMTGPRGFLNPSARSLTLLGAQVWPLIFQGEIHRIVSYTFVHIGIIHFFFNTIVLMLGLPISVAASLALAVILSNRLQGNVAFRTIFYMPSVVSGVAIFLLWQWIYNKEYGLLNQAIRAILQYDNPPG